MRGGNIVLDDADDRQIRIDRGHSVRKNEVVTVFSRILEIIVVVQIDVDHADTPCVGAVGHCEGVVPGNLSVHARNLDGLLLSSADLEVAVDFFVVDIAFEFGVRRVPLFHDEIGVVAGVTPGACGRRVVIDRGAARRRGLGTQNGKRVSEEGRHRPRPMLRFALDCFCMRNAAFRGPQHPGSCPS